VRERFLGGGGRGGLKYEKLLRGGFWGGIILGEGGGGFWRGGWKGPVKWSIE
jgi:hypothetical protein